MAMPKKYIPYTLPAGKVLALKVLYADRTSAHNNFKYPGPGKVVVDPLWDGGKLSCGGGLHGFIWGLGNIGISMYDVEIKLVFQVHEVTDYVDLIDKIKYPSALVVEEFEEITKALDFINKFKPIPLPHQHSGKSPVILLQNSLSESIKLNDTLSTASIQESLSHSIQVSENSFSIQKAMDNSIQTSARKSKQIAGNHSIQIGKESAIQTAGDFSFQRANNFSKCKIGSYSVQRLGEKSIFSAGINSYVLLTVRTKNKRKVEKMFFVDGKKIKEHTWYGFYYESQKLREVSAEGIFITPENKFKAFIEKIMASLQNLPSTLGF